jgi:phosphoribosylpyrophosphate synthetase
MNLNKRKRFPKNDLSALFDLFPVFVSVFFFGKL